MKILFISADASGGAGLAALRQIESLRLLGHDVDLETISSSSSVGKFALKKRAIKARLNRKFEYECLRRTTINDGLYKSLGWLPFNPLFGIDLNKYDIIHFHWVNKGFLGLNHISKVSGKHRAVWTMHSFWPFSNPDHHFREKKSSKKLNWLQLKISQWEQDAMLSVKLNLKVWVLPSNFMKDELDNQLAISVIGNSVDHQTVRISSFPNNHRNSFAFICAGDVFDPRKGLKTLLESWIRISSQNQDSELYIVGPKYSHSEIAYLSGISKTKNVHFIGELKPGHIRQFLSLIDGLFVPSLEETFGQTILESLSVGTPVIVNSQLKSIGEFASGKKIVRKINFEEPEELLRSIGWVKQIDFSRDEIQKKILTDFGPLTIGTKLSEVYLQLLNQDQISKFE